MSTESSDTQHFEVDTGATDLFGIYCSYCGEKIIPKVNSSTNKYVFQCSCANATQELHLIDQQENAQNALKEFRQSQLHQIQITQLKIFIISYERQVGIMKDALQELSIPPDTNPPYLEDLEDFESADSSS